MEAVTSTDYDSANLSHNFNQIGFSTYNYSQFEEKYKSQQNSTKLGTISQTLSCQSNDFVSYLYDDKYPRNQLQSDNNKHPQQQQQQQHPYVIPQEIKSKSLTYYQIDPAPKHETRHSKCHRSAEKNNQHETGILTIGVDDKKDSRASAGGSDKNEKRDKGVKCSNQKFEPKINGASSNHQQLIKSSESVDECHLGQMPPNQHQQQLDPSSKYRQFDRPPKYQEYPPRDSMRCEPAPRYYQDPPKYSDVIRRDDFKKISVSKFLFFT